MSKLYQRWVAARDHETIETRLCWCGGPIGLRPNGSLGCLATTAHDWDATGRPKQTTRLYVAGPATGYKDRNFPAFEGAASVLRAAGYEVIEPVEYGNGRHYVDILRESLHMMLDCHAVAVLENWWESPGARNEVQVAGLLRMPVRTVQEWVDRAS